MRRVFLLLTLSVLLSACSFNGDKEKNNNWQNEVLFASECGLSGMQCCQSEEACKYGNVCCINPNNIEENYCDSECSLGLEDKFCRDSEPKCDTGMACYQGKCQFSGGENQPCDDSDPECDDDLICYNGLCLKCGLSGNPCCENTLLCDGLGVFDKNRTECLNDMCQPCGFVGKKACQNEPHCNIGNLNNNNYCLQCGVLNTPCCKNGKNVFCDNGLVCNLGFCESIN